MKRLQSSSKIIALIFGLYMLLSRVSVAAAAESANVAQAAPVALTISQVWLAATGLALLLLLAVLLLTNDNTPQQAKQ